MIVMKFYSETCAPCKAIDEGLRMACEQNHVELFSMNTANCQEVCAEFNIRSVPTVIAFFNGNELGRFIGYKTEKEISEWLEKLK